MNEKKQSHIANIKTKRSEKKGIQKRKKNEGRKKDY